MNKNSNFYELNTEEVLEKLNTSLSGLKLKQVAEIQKNIGLNELPTEKPDTYLILFLKQFKNPLIYALILIAIITFLISEYTDSIIISVVLLFNAIIGLVQEGRAQRTILSLQKLTKSTSLVKRKGKEMVIGSEELVPGDILILREGDKVVADIRLLEANNIIVNEAVLTGESESVSKIAKKISGEKVLLSEQVNMLFAGTFINTGLGKGVVVKTGKNTELGKIANSIQKAQPEIPLQAALKKLTNIIVIGIFIFSIIFFMIGIFSGKEIREMFLLVSSLLVAIIPEGLPVVLTLLLAQGVKKMAEKKVLVKKLQAVEALGQTNIIAVDKTGTITKNELTVVKIILGKEIFNVSGNGYEPYGKVTDLNNQVITINNNKRLEKFAEYGIASANARVFRPDSNEPAKIIGDPTEAAMLVFGEKVGFNKQKMIDQKPILDEIPFSYHNKFYANLHLDKISGSKLIIVSGAPEAILIRCNSFINNNNEKENLNFSDLEILNELIKELTKEGLRVIGLATKESPNNKHQLEHSDISNLTLCGFYAMQDDLRTEVRDSVNKAKNAGIKIIMITGDRKETAFNIAQKAGIIKDDLDQVLTGNEIDQFDDLALKNSVLDKTVFARVNPNHKLRIIKAFQENNQIIAMTGDGVNDVPSLANANLGVAMGITGTEVAKEASDIVLLDDNFGNIPEAVEEGRHMYLSIKKALLYLFATNLAEMFLVVVAFFAGIPSPFEPAQIIWLNLITDSFMVLPLALEPKNKDVMKTSFKQSKLLIDKKMFLRMIFLSTTMTILCFIVFSFYLDLSTQLAKSVVLTTLVVCQFITAWAIRSNDRPIWEKSPFQNKWLIFASIFIVLLQVMAINTSFFQKILLTIPLSLTDWLIAFGIGTIYLGIDQANTLLKKIFKNFTI